MSPMLAAAVLGLAILATGLALLDLLRLEEPSPLLRLALAIALGFASTMLALYLPLAILDRVAFWPALVLLGAGSLCAAWRWRTSLPGLHELTPSTRVVVLIVALGVPMAASCLLPYRGYDSKAIFALKGKVLLYERGVHGPLFQDVDLVHYHPDYPLGIPLLMALSGWVAEGEPQDPTGARAADSAEEWVERHDAINAYMVLALIWVLGVVCAIAGIVRRHVRGALLSAALVATTLPIVIVFPAISYPGWRSVAAGDRPLTLCLGIAGLACARWLGGGRRCWLALAVVCAAGATLVKNEAVLALGALSLAGFLHGSRRRASLAAAMLLLAILCGSLLVYAVGSRTAGAPYDEHYASVLSIERIAVALQRLPQLPGAIWDTLKNGETLAFWILFWLLAAPLAWLRGGGARVLLAWIGLYQLLCAAVMLVTPNHLVWHVNTAANRLWFQLTIPAALLVVEAVVRVWSGRASASALEPASGGTAS